MLWLRWVGAMMVAAMAALPAGQGDGKTYVNPVLGRDFPDPFVIRHQGKFYAYATGFQVAESDDLVHWTHRGQALKLDWSKEHYWAPEVVVRGRTLYMIYSALDPKTRKHDIGIATATSPLGPFTQKAILVEGDANDVGVIDATIFFDGRSPYLVYSEEEPRSIVLAPLATDLMRTTGPATKLIQPDRDWERRVTEAPTMIKRNGTYHLFYSVGWFQSAKGDASYAVCHATSRTLAGPYVKDAEPLLRTVPGKVYGPGHQCLVELPSGETWMVYHGWDAQGEPRYGGNPLGRTMRMDRLEWRGDVPSVVGPSTSPQAAPRVR